MLGLADRGLVMDLMEAAMKGDVAACLSLMDRAHERGADPGVILQDMLELTHTLSRLVSVPSLAADPSLSEEERTRGVALARSLSIPVLGRAWQMLLKGLAEVNEAPDRRAAAEMVLIRLAHVAELPTPGDILRRLSDGNGALGGAGRPAPDGAGPAQGPRGLAGGGGAMRAVAGGGGVAQGDPGRAAMVGAVPAPQSWRDVVALASGRRPMLHAHLLHSVHPVRVTQGRIEMRVRPEAPRDLAAQLGALLQELTGTRWTIVLSNAEGEPTLAEQGRAAEAERRSLAASHPLVQAILAAFPGASIEAVRDAGADAYGLPLVALASEEGEEAPDGPDFAPPGGVPSMPQGGMDGDPDAEPADFDDIPPEAP